MEFLAGLYTLLLVTICLLLAAVLWKLNKPRNGGDYEELKRWMQQQLDAQAKDFAARQAAMAEQNYTAIRSVSETLQTSVQSMSTTLAQGQSGQQQILTQRLQSLEAANTQKLEELRKTLAENMTALQAENAKKLDEIRHTVDEQLQDALQKRVTESFKAVNDQLEQVYKGLGEMQNLAADVGGLKQVLSGVKTRGILGEIQLGAILEEILAPEQYETNVATIPGSTQRVEYAIRMPGTDGGTVWLPIDSKFPGDTYAHLQDAQASGDAQAVENARHALELVLRSEAKDIREKYVEPPYTTTFGILFLPFEGLYAEVVNAGLLEVLQRENIRLLVTCEDPSLTARHITEAYHLPEGMITLLDQEQCSALTPAQPDETARCCMLHDKGFASLIGGLRAAEKAQNAETSATTVQMVSVWFSVVIGALLTYAGSIGTLSVAAVLMYQAAWSALSIAVCALKQHN